MMRVLVLIASFMLGVVNAAAQPSAPQPPDQPTSYSECDAFYAQYSSYLAQLRAASTACSAAITRPSQRQVRIQCSPLTWGEQCAAQVEASACASEDLTRLLRECRAKVREYEASQGKEQPQISDYRDGLLASYFEDATGLDNMLPEAGKEFTDKVGQLQSAISMNPSDPAAILNASKDFSSGVLASAGANDLAQSLFDSASQGAANAGLMAVEDAVAALNGFEADFVAGQAPPAPELGTSAAPVAVSAPPSSEPIYREPFEVFDVPPPEAATAQPSVPIEKPKQHPCGDVPEGYGMCLKEGIRNCAWVNGAWILTPVWYPNCGKIGTLHPM